MPEDGDYISKLKYYLKDGSGHTLTKMKKIVLDNILSFMGKIFMTVILWYEWGKNVKSQPIHKKQNSVEGELESNEGDDSQNTHCHCPWVCWLASNISRNGQQW